MRKKKSVGSTIFFWLVLLRIVMEIHSKHFVAILLPSIKKGWLFEI